MNHSFEISLGKSNVDTIKQYLPGTYMYKQTLSLPHCEIFKYAHKASRMVVEWDILLLSHKHKHKVCFLSVD